MTRTIEATGARRVKRYRVYQRDLDPRPAPEGARH
jgi:hypothetical protein